MEEVKTRVCEMCGGVFVPRMYNQKRCNKPGCPSFKLAEAQRKSYYRNKEKPLLGGKPVQTCSICGKKFVVEKTLREKYCCAECKRIANNYSNYCNYSKKRNTPVIPLNKYLCKSLPMGHPVRKELNLDYDLSDLIKIASEKKENNERKPMEQINRPIYNNNISKPTHYVKQHYTPEDLEKKLDAKTERIISTIDALSNAGIEKQIIFDAVKNITRMPLKNF